MSALDILTDAGLNDTHWGQRIINAERRGHFNAHDVSDSACWVTCACGKLDLWVQKCEKTFAPSDPKLYRLGALFYLDVRDHHFVKAAETLVAINSRTTELYKEMINVQIRQHINFRD